MTIRTFGALLCGAAFLLATQTAALAATTVKGTRSNGSEFNACVKGGGTVKKDAKGNQDCTPKASAARGTTTNSSKSNSDNRMGGGGGKGY